MIGRRILTASAVVALVVGLAARMLGPSDLWDHSQPKTVSYTTDILVNGRWILPIERGELPATKPPLYNWLAAPAVKIVGFSSEWAHKSPSIVAFVGVWAVTIWLGARIDKQGGAVGWLAGLAVATNYMFYKLGYLARPDMLLTLWLVLGWMTATAILLNSSGRGVSWLQFAFWACVALAGITKGPPALVLLLYAIVAAKALTGSWRSAGRLGWWWGLPLALLIVGSWLGAVWRINPDHLVNELWYAEVADRVLGSGPKGAEGEGRWHLVTSIPYMPYYFLVRFAPWSLFTVLGIVHLWRRARAIAPPVRNWKALRDGDGRWYHACAVFIVVTIVVFTLSAGKRADYIASTIPPGAILAAYWLLRVRSGVARWSPFLAPVVAAGSLATAVTIDYRQGNAPSRTYGNNIRSFIDSAAEAIDARPLPIVFYHAWTSHLQAFLGKSEVDHADSLRTQLARGEPFWLVSGAVPKEAPRLHQLVAEARDDGHKYTLRPVVVSEPEVPGATWPGRTALWLVEPAGEEKAKQLR